ncbi:uncharacterized protein LOC101859440 [Aplysia californica]|uniref:Uncharacterized protein LOC101859440 n=1 Tax=Aplysia californica TaxID=6500 RepID=A0ABM0K4X6_APLCA|nr:uncharacterized protein LOC101859440 [Aplysia californica]
MMSRVPTILLVSAVTCLWLAATVDCKPSQLAEPPLTLTDPQSADATSEAAEDTSRQERELDYHDFLHCMYYDGTQWQKYVTSSEYYRYTHPDHSLTAPQAVANDPNSKIESDYWYDYYLYENASHDDKLHTLTKPDFKAEHGFEPDYHDPTWNFWLHFWQKYFTTMRPECRQGDLDYFNSNGVVPGDDDDDLDC